MLDEADARSLSPTHLPARIDLPGAGLMTSWFDTLAEQKRAAPVLMQADDSVSSAVLSLQDITWAGGVTPSNDLPCEAEPEAAPDIEQELSAGVLRLDPEHDAVEFQKAILAMLPCTSVRIEASGVAVISFSLLQVLLSAMKDALARGECITILNPSFAFTLTFDILGFSGPNEPFIVEYS